MVDYFIYFLCLFDVGIFDKVVCVFVLFQEFCVVDQDVDDLEVVGFDFVFQDVFEGSVIWIYDDDYGDVEVVICFVLCFVEEIDFVGFWGFQYVLICFWLCFDVFGGGVYVIDFGVWKFFGWISSYEWLVVVFNGEDIDV